MKGHRRQAGPARGAGVLLRFLDVSLSLSLSILLTLVINQRQLLLPPPLFAVIEQSGRRLLSGRQRRGGGLDIVAVPDFEMTIYSVRAVRKQRSFRTRYTMTGAFLISRHEIA